MAELVLTFTPPPLAELISTRFAHRRLARPVEARLGVYDRSFRWTAGVKALAALLLRTAAWGRSGREDDPKPPCLEGHRPSPAASLNDALTTKPRWAEDVFGTGCDGRPLLCTLLGRWNADFNTSPNAPVKLWVEGDELPADGIRVVVDGGAVDDPARLSELADDIGRQWRPVKGRPAEPSGAGGPSGTSAAGGLGVRLKVNKRLVAIEIELDRDFDTFGPEDERELLLALQGLLKTGREIAVRGRRRGSVILTVDLPPDQARAVLRRVAAGALSHLRVVDARRARPSPLPVPVPEPADGDATRVQGCLDRLRGGDREALDDLYRVVGARLERLVDAMHRRSGVAGFVEAGDILQTGWLRLVRELREAPPATAREFFGLAASQLRRVLIEIARQHRREPVADPGAIAAAVAGPPTDRSELWSRFHEAVEELPPAEREVFGLTYYHGLTSVRVAELCRINPRTVRRWFQSACVRLQGKLGDLSGLSS